MYTSRTKIPCNSPQWGQCTVSVAHQTAHRLCTSISMPVGACLKVLGQVKDRGAMDIAPPWFDHRRERDRSLCHRRLAQCLVGDTSQRSTTNDVPGAALRDQQPQPIESPQKATARAWD